MFLHSSSYFTYHNKAHRRPDPVAQRLRVFDSVLPLPLRGRSCSFFASTPKCLSEDRQPLPPPATPPSPTLCVSVAPWLMSQCFTNGRSTLHFPSPLFLLTKKLHWWKLTCKVDSSVSQPPKPPDSTPHQYCIGPPPPPPLPKHTFYILWATWLLSLLSLNSPSSWSVTQRFSPIGIQVEPQSCIKLYGESLFFLSGTNALCVLNQGYIVPFSGFATILF